MLDHQLVSCTPTFWPRYGVDLVFNGHVHSYERSFPVYNNSLNECSLGSDTNQGGKEIQTEDWWFAVGNLEVVGGLLVVELVLSIREQGFYCLYLEQTTNLTRHMKLLVYCF